MPEKLNKNLLTEKEIKKIYNSRYYTKLKEEKRNISTECDCGGKYNLYTKKKHLLSKKHLFMINKKKMMIEDTDESIHK